MAQTLLITGLACLIAAVVGGGLRAFQVEIPLVGSIGRQILLAILGLVLVGGAYVTAPGSDDNAGGSSAAVAADAAVNAAPATDVLAERSGRETVPPPPRRTSSGDAVVVGPPPSMGDRRAD